jgi:hypothetical protein
MWIKLGKDIFTGEPVYCKLHEYGNLCFAAPPRYGKTTLVKNILVQVQGSCRVVVLDFYDQEYAALEIPNMLSRTGMSIPDIQILSCRDFGFLPQQLDQRDLEALGFSGPATNAALELIETLSDYEPADILEVFKELPEGQESKHDGTIERFNDKYGTNFQETLFPQSKQNLINNFDALVKSRFFVTQREIDAWEQSEGKWGRAVMTREHLESLLRRGHIRFNFNLTANEIGIAQLYTGKLMYLMREMPPCGKCMNCNSDKECRFPQRPLTEAYSVMLVVEEADKILPNWAPSDIASAKKIPVSLQEAQEWIRKLGRYKARMMTICQDLSNLHYIFRGKNAGGFAVGEILGNVGGSHPAALRLKNIPDLGVRQFLYVDGGSGSYKVFQPENIAVLDVRRKFNLDSKLPLKYPSPGLVGFPEVKPLVTQAGDFLRM